MNIEIICPLYKGEKYIENLHKSISKQKNVKIKKISYVLTDTNDNSESILKELKANYTKIKPSEFSHSLTRENAAMKSKADIIVFITQDIEIRNDNWLEELVTPIIKGECVASYSRQLTKFNNIEKYTREANYPDKSFIKSKKDIKKMGLKTFFFSDACSAIDSRVYKKLNGYDGKNLPTNEDMYIAYKLIMNGYKIKYCANSIVYHSHNFKLKEIYNRYKLTGLFFKQNKYLDEYGTNGSGASLAKYVLKRILQEHRIGLLFRYPFDMAARLFGMKAGER
ncbi:MAG: glycosyltransferase [Bacilli bacterium]|nr:glycosyltransferase [Bacilli bacterium]